jgi:aspartyl-tRNA(Asn)/glutamyl-tRNA(Gln) amidotransferase subunit A
LNHHRLPDLHEISSRIAHQDVSSVELVEQALETAERLNPTLNAYITILADQARSAAKVAQQEILDGRQRSPLHGIPVSVKDLYSTRNTRTTCGSRVLKDWVPAENAALVERLEDAGAIIIAKANMLEFAYASVHPDYGPTRNPWDLSRTTSGSSGGSAASVAAGIDFGSFGTDTGGSIRIPAAFCGVAGLKPTYGLVSRFGMFPVSWTLDHAGPFARSARDIALLLEAIAGHDPRDRYSADFSPSPYSSSLGDSLENVTIGLITNFMDAAVDGEVRTAVDDAVNVLADAGANVQRTEIPELEGDAINAVLPFILAEASYVHRDWIKDHESDYTETVLQRLRAGQAITAVAYFAAQDERERIRQRIREIQRDMDLLVLPTAPFAATPLEATTLKASEGEQDLAALIRMTAPFDLTGQPALSIPCGFTTSGLPIGLQIVGRDFEDAMVLRAGHAFQSRTDWHQHVPPVSA